MEQRCSTCQHTSYPTIEETYQVEEELTQRASMDKASLAALFAQVRWLPTWEYGRHYLEGIAIQQEGERLALMGSDGVCLVKTRGPHAPTWQRPVLLNPKLLQRALRVLPKGGVTLEAVFTQHQLLMRNGEQVSDASPMVRAAWLRLSAQRVCVTLGLMNEAFPTDYGSKIEGALSESAMARGVCSTAQLRNALLTASALDNWMVLQVGASALGITSLLHKQEAGEPRLQMSVPLLERTGPDLAQLVDVSYLLRALETVEAPQVALELHAREANAPKVVLRQWGEQQVEDYFLLLAAKPVPTPVVEGQQA